MEGWLWVSQMEATCIAWKQKWRHCWSLADISWDHLPQFSYSSSILKGKNRHAGLLCTLCKKGQYPGKSLPGAENSPSWVKDIPFGEENKGRNWHVGTDSTTAKQSRFTRAWERMPRISLEALVCADTKASNLQVNLPSYHFQMNQEKSNIHKPEEQDLKGPQMWTQNLCCLFSDILRARAVLLQCQVTVFPWGRCWGGL